MSTPPLDAPTTARLARGEVLVRTEHRGSSPQPWLVVDAMIAAPPERVWRLIDLSDNYARYMPRVKTSKEVSRRGDEVRTKMTVDMPFPLKNLTATTVAKHLVDPGVRYERSWRLESGDYHFNEGRWVFRPFDDDPEKTYAHYEIHVLPKIKIPKAIQGAVQERAMPKMIDALRQEVRRGG